MLTAAAESLRLWRPRLSGFRAWAAAASTGTVLLSAVGCAAGRAPSQPLAGATTAGSSPTSAQPQTIGPAPGGQVTPARRTPAARSEPPKPTPRGVRPPGPPGATFPDGLQPIVDAWYRDLAAGSCTQLVNETTQALAAPTFQPRDLARLYRSAGNACRGRLDVAAADLQGIDVSAWQDCSGQPPVLKLWVEAVLAAGRGDTNAGERLRHFPAPAYSNCPVPPGSVRPTSPTPSTTADLPPSPSATPRISQTPASYNAPGRTYYSPRVAVVRRDCCARIVGQVR